MWHTPSSGRPLGCLGCSRLSNRTDVTIGDDYEGRKSRSTGKWPWRLAVTGPKRARVLFVWPQPSMRAVDHFAVHPGDESVIRKALANTDVPETDTAHTGATRCYGDESKTPDDVLRACSSWLEHDIRRFDPDIIVPIGSPAMKGLLGPGYDVESACGQGFAREIAGRKRTVVACLNPASAYYRPEAAARIQTAISNVADIYHGRTKVARGLGKYRRMSLVDAALALDAITDGVVSIDIESSGLDPYNKRLPARNVHRSEDAAAKASEVLGRRVRPSEEEFSGDYKTEELDTFVPPTIAVVSWSTKEGTGQYVLRDHMDDPGVSAKDREAFDKALASLLTRKAVRKVFHNAVHELTWFYAFYGVFPKNFRDTLVLEYIRDENKTKDLLSVALRETGMGNWSQQVEGFGKRIGYDYRYLPVEMAGAYAAADADVALRSYLKNVRSVPKSQRPLYHRFFPRLIVALANMHTVMAKTDQKAAKLYARYTKAKAAEAFKALQDTPGVRRLIRKVRFERGDEDFIYNPNSPPQTSRLLYEILQRPVRYTTKKKRGSTAKPNPSTAALALKEMVRLDKCETAKSLLSYRRYDKQHGSFGLKLFAQCLNFGGCAAGHFKPTGTVTGRLASSDPNLQNLPKPARRVFVSRFGNDGCLVQSDFSQIELRVTASLTGDPRMLQIYQNGEDIHKTTMCTIFGLSEADCVRLEKESPEDFGNKRTAAKRTNFGVVYDTQSQGLMNTLRKDGVVVSESEAETFITRFYGLFTEIQPWKADVLERARDVGYAESPLGRRRHLPDLHNEDIAARSEAERQGPNSVIQGTASDLMTTAIINIRRELKRRKMRTVLVLTVHDSLLADCPLSEVEEYMSIAREHQQNVPKYADRVWGTMDWSWIKCPIVADFEIGLDWRNMAKVKGGDFDLHALLAKSRESQAQNDKIMRDEIAALELATETAA